MSLENLITDRTEQDVERVKELASKSLQDMTISERDEWFSPMKGAYNYTDLNRVGEALNYLRDRLAEGMYLSTSIFDARTDWSDGDIPTIEDINNYLRCVYVIREALAQFPTTPIVPSSPSLGYQEANNIEQILADVGLLITKVAAAWFYADDIFTGEV